MAGSTLPLSSRTIFQTDCVVSSKIQFVTATLFSITNPGRVFKTLTGGSGLIQIHILGFLSHHSLSLSSKYEQNQNMY